MIGGKVVEKCLGIGFDDKEKVFHNGRACTRILDGKCIVYINPSIKWDRGPIIASCPLATHYVEYDLTQVKGRAGQQKGRRGKKAR